MKTSDIYSSGILNKGEELTECFKGTYYQELSAYGGFIVFTNKRFIFVRRPPGLFTKGFDVVAFASWADILSVSTTGLISKRMNMSVQSENGNKMYIFSCNKVEDTAKKIIQAKSNYVEARTIEAKKIVIEEANKDNAMTILQKRLARGEITLEEFNKLVQRT